MKILPDGTITELDSTFECLFQTGCEHALGTKVFKFLPHLQVPDDIDELSEEVRNQLAIKISQEALA